MSRCEVQGCREKPRSGPGRGSGLKQYEGLAFEDRIFGSGEVGMYTLNISGL